MWADRLEDFQKFSNSWHDAFVFILGLFCWLQKKEERKGSIVACSITLELNPMVWSQVPLFKTIDNTGYTLSASIYPSVIWQQRQCTLTLQLEWCGMSRYDRGYAVPATWSAWPQEDQTRTWEKQDFWEYDWWEAHFLKWAIWECMLTHDQGNLEHCIQGKVPYHSCTRGQPFLCYLLISRTPRQKSSKAWNIKNYIKKKNSENKITLR